MNAGERTTGRRRWARIRWPLIACAAICAAILMWRLNARQHAWDERLKPVRTLLAAPRVYRDLTQMCWGIFYYADLNVMDYPGFMRDNVQIGPGAFIHFRRDRDATLAVVQEMLRDHLALIQPSPDPSPAELEMVGDLVAIANDLNGVELLPDILELERRLAALNPYFYLEPSDIPKAVAFPAGSFEAANKLQRERGQFLDANGASFDEIRAHMVTLSAIAAMLRQERHPGILATPWEAQFLKETAEPLKPSEPRRAFWPVDGKTEWNSGFVDYDLFPRGLQQIEVSPEVRRQVIGWAEEFLRDTPPEKRLAAKGMSEKLTYR